MWMESNSNLFDVCKIRPIVTASSLAFSAVSSRFPQLLKCDTNMVVSYRVVPYLQHCYASLVMSNAVHNYLKMLHKHCNTDMLGVLLIYPHSPSGAAYPQDHAYISVKPLATVLQPINIPLPALHKICPSLKITAQLLYNITDVDCDSGMLL